MGKKANVVSFRSLSARQRADVARRMTSAVTRFSAGGKYEPVEGETRLQRAPSFVEFYGEDKVLPAYNRNLLINLMRNSMRNAATARGIDQQRRVNVVGSVGGKLTMSFSDDAAAKAAKPWEDWFNYEWAPQAEFTDGMCFNELLKLVLTSRDTGGDCVLLFDDGTLTGSGKIRAFEADEIASLPSSEFAARFGKKGWTQAQGKIYDRYGRSLGVIVSTSQRGLSEFDPARSFVLVRDPDADRRDAYWAMIRDAWRFNQGRGISPLSAAIDTLTDIHEITASETQSAKMNSKLLGQLIDEREDAESPAIPKEYAPVAPGDDPDAQAAEDETATAADAENKDSEEEVKKSFQSFDAIGAMFDLMPPKIKMELLDTKRPNPNISAFIDFLTGQCTSVFGMGRVYATLNPESSYTAFRGAQCLAKPSFEEAQKTLERYCCDWAARNALRWAERLGKVPGKLPDGWQHSFVWSWPEMPEVNEVDAQSAEEKKLSNMTDNYHRIFGPSWKERLQQTFDEIDFFQKNGKVHPSQKTVSGAIVDVGKTGAVTPRGKDTEQ